MRLPEKVADLYEQANKPQKCNIEGCTNAAGWSPRIRVWAKGYPKSSAPISMMLNIAVCDGHKDALDPKTFWTEEGALMVRDAIVVRGLAEPDFSTTEIDMLPLGSPI